MLFVHTAFRILATLPCIILLVYMREWEVKWALLITISLVYRL